MNITVLYTLLNIRMFEANHQEKQLLQNKYNLRQHMERKRQQNFSINCGKPDQSHLQ